MAVRMIPLHQRCHAWTCWSSSKNCSSTREYWTSICVLKVKESISRKATIPTSSMMRSTMVFCWPQVLQSRRSSWRSVWFSLSCHVCLPWWLCFQVRYSTLITVLLQDAVGLNEHDRYVCHGYRDPFDCRAPGYNETEIQAGRIVTCKVKPSVVVQRKSHRPSYEYETWVWLWSNTQIVTLLIIKTLHIIKCWLKNI